MYCSLTGEPGVQPHHTISPDRSDAEPVVSLVAATGPLPAVATSPPAAVMASTSAAPSAPDFVLPVAVRSDMFVNPPVCLLDPQVDRKFSLNFPFRHASRG